MKTNIKKLALAVSLTLPVTQLVSAAVLEEIIVTAEKRSESIQDVPISVQAFSEDLLDKAVITSPVQLGEITPGLQYSKQTGQANPYIRGIGTQNTAVGDESTVGTYIDGVYIMGMQASMTSFNNIERVEVLKGPQGTLFGRNTTGGLIHIITKDPVHEPTARIGLDYGEYETAIARFYGSMGISDTVAADISVFYSDQGEGYGENLVTGKDVNLSKDKVIRSKWLIEPNEDLTIKLAFDYAKSKTDIASARGPIKGTVGTDGALGFLGCAGIMNFSDIPTVPPATAQACTAFAQSFGTTYPGDPQDIQANIQSPSQLVQRGESINIRYAMENFDIVSITAYRNTTVDAWLDQDGSALQLVDARLDREEDQFTQEFQLVSNGDGDLSWIVGAFYMDAESKYAPFQLEGLGLALLLPGTTFINLEDRQTLESKSVFAQGTYSISEQLDLTLGARYTKDSRELKGVETIYNAGFPGGQLSAPFDTDKDFSKATWRLAVDYDLTDDMLLYASYSRGFKSGVYNSVVTKGFADPPVNPEVVDAYEVGVKSEWLGGTVRANAAVFYYDYQDLQLQFVNAGNTILSNAATAEIYGGELEMVAAITDNLDVRLGISVLDAEYKEFEGGVFSTPNDVGYGPIGGNTVFQGDASGNDMARAPDFTSSLGVNYSQPVTDTLVLGANVNWYHNDGFYWYEDNRVKQDAYDVVNAEISLASADESWKLRVWAKNLTDEEYSIFTNTGQFGDLSAPAEPRVAGVGAEFRF